MSHAHRNKLVFTVKNRCRVCYTCVRECPVKAIRIVNGQAEVISERCIGCGNCVKVCSQEAKVFLDSKKEVFELISAEKKVVACIAPSFPAEFTDISDFKIIVGMLKSLGFDKVVEVAFGADIVAKYYAKLLEESNVPHISSDCPAVVYFIEHYHPELVSSLAPIASPMVAMSRIVKKEYSDVNVVFIGPCIAKKAESDEINEAITFKELREMFESKQITPQNVISQNFDPPFSGKGSIFAVSRGLLQTINKTDDITDGKIIAACGSKSFREVIKEFEDGNIRNSNLELLCCDGCIMGPGMSKMGQRYSRRASISKYVKDKLDNLDVKAWEQNIEKFSNIKFSQTFNPADRRNVKPSKEEIEKVLKSMGKNEPKDYLNCGACGYNTCEEHAIAIIEGLAENEMCLPYSIEKLHHSIEDLNISNTKLANAQQALRQSEKLANMGQLSAGIAHELNNPLGIITMYSNILKDESKEDDPNRKDLELIVEQADRCKKIVSGLLNFARKNQVNLVETNIEQLCRHSLESVINSGNIKFDFQSSLTNPLLMIDSDQMMQVLTNLEKNAVEAMPEGGLLKIQLNGNEKSVEINISDTGSGIAKKHMDKIFTPFFTTKQLGQGTGLGLPLIYGIVKMHKGQIEVTSNADANVGPTGTNFKIVLPRLVINKQKI
jgi:iron only hydrogenase large subunit-like protein/nitrogen-specific signal transduction histidine kinase